MLTLLSASGDAARCVLDFEGSGRGFFIQCGEGSGVRLLSCVFSGNDYPSPAVGGYGADVYFARLVSGDDTTARKMVLVR